MKMKRAKLILVKVLGTTLIVHFNLILLRGFSLAIKTSFDKFLNVVFSGCPPPLENPLDPILNEQRIHWIKLLYFRFQRGL